MTISNELVAQEIGEQEWPALAAACSDHNYEQCRSYSLAMAAKSGSSAHFVELLRHGRRMGLASVRIKRIPLLDRGVAYVSGGPLLVTADGGLPRLETYSDAVDALISRFVRTEGHILLLRPPLLHGVSAEALDGALTSRGLRQTSDVRAYTTVIVSLAEEEAAMRKRLHQKWRNCLNQSQRAGLAVTAGAGPEFAARFLAIYHSMREMKSFDSTIDPAFFLGLDHQDTGTIILIAQSEGRDVGGHVLSVLGQTSVYLFGATNDEGRDTRAGYLLQWEAMAYAKAHGALWYDLGGIDAAENPGGYQFKTRMGGAIARAAGPYKRLPHGLLAPVLDRALSVYAARTRRKVMKVQAPD